MTICDNCGGELVRKNNNIYQCQHCLNEKTLFRWGDELDVMLNKALHLRLNNAYDLAHGIYLDIIRRNADCIDAYWGALLSKYGVEISERTKFRPSLHKISEHSFTSEKLYKDLLANKNVDGIASVEYKKMADEIELVRCEAIKAAQTQPKYDVFLSFKNKAGDGDDDTLTEDRAVAERLYNTLTKRGYRVFFAPVTLKGKAGLVYEPIIYAALHSADTMVLIASKKKYIESPWVANEWRRFKEIIAASKRGMDNKDLRLFVCHSGELNSKNLPDELERYQTVNLDSKDGEKELLDNFDKNQGSQKVEQRQARAKKKAANAKLYRAVFIVALVIILAAGGGIGIYFWMRPVPVQSVAITSKTTVGIGEEVTLTADISPAKAKNRKVTFRIVGENTIDAVITNGVFSAPREGSVNIVATAGGVDSAEVKIDVVHVPVLSITVSCADSFKVTQTLELSASFVPANATNKAVTYEIVTEGTTAAGAAIANGRLSATSVGVIKVKAISAADAGVASPVFTISVLKEPVVSVANTNAKNGYYPKETVTETFNTDNLSAKGWALTGGNAFYINNNGYTGSFYVAVGKNYDSLSSYLYKNIRLGEDESITLSLYAKSDPSMDRGLRIRLSNDNGASWVSVYETNTSSSWANYTATIYGSQIEGENRDIRLALFSKNNTYINFDDITYSINSPCPAFSAGSSLTLTGTVAPSNATYPDITYEIIPDGTTAAGAAVTGNVLTATGAGIIRLRPVADGVYGEEFFVKVE